MTSDDILVKLLWSHEYSDIMLEAIWECPNMQQELITLLDKQSQRSCANLKGDALKSYFKKIDLTVAGSFAMLMKAKDVRHKSLWLAARSISAYRQQLPTRWWNSDRKQKLLLGHGRTLDIIKAMSKDMPKPSFKVACNVLELCYDQCHLWKGPH